MLDLNNSIPVRLAEAKKEEFSAFFREMELKNGDGNNEWMKAECYCPITFALREILAKRLEMDVRKATQNEYIHASFLATIVSWNKAKVIYEFDPDVSIELMRQSRDDVKVTSDLIKLPNWCVYLKMPGSNINGIFVSFEWYPQGKYLCIIPAKDDTKNLVLAAPIFLPLPEEPQTVDQIIESMYWRSVGRLRKQGMTMKEIGVMVIDKKIMIKYVLNALFYLTAVNSDVVLKKGKTDKEDTEKKDTADVTHYMVGEKTGARLKMFHKAHVAYMESAKKGHHESPIMHIRRAHWHTYLTGKGRTKKVLKWQLPIVVNKHGKEIDVVSLIQVKNEQNTDGENND